MAGSSRHRPRAGLQKSGGFTVDCYIANDYYNGMHTTYMAHKGGRLPYGMAFRALEFWQARRKDTCQIAQALAVHESAVYNSLHAIRSDIRRYGFVRIGRSKLA